MDQLDDDYAIGLDLGTTFSCIGVYKNGGVKIIPNRLSEKSTPSLVIMVDDEKDGFKPVVGEDTIDYLVKNYDTCIYEVKRLIGRDYSDPEFQKEKEKLPFNIVNNNGFPEVEIKIKGKSRTFSPVEISSLIIKKMILNAENYLNKKINKIIITVPANFNDSQRKLTKKAAESLGLKVIRVINEPTAAALSYGFDKKNKINENILVFDLGGGTFDVSILSIKEDEKNPDEASFKVLATSGDTHLGGEDFDNELVEYFLKKRKDQEKEIRKDKQAIKKLKIACENAKKRLSISEEYLLRINNFYKNQDFTEKITRKEFEEKCAYLFNKFDVSLNDALKAANLTKEDINEIILVGGSTRIPKVKEKIKQFFPKCKINDSINPDEAVAYGATLYAEKIMHNRDASINNFIFLDITPLSLGTNVINKSQDPDIKKEGDLMSIIIKRGTFLPTFSIKNYLTSKDNQTEMSIDIYEGEKKYVKENHLLKKSIIKGLTKRPKRKTKVIVKFNIDINGILNVSAKEEAENGQTLQLIIEENKIEVKKNIHDMIQKLVDYNKININEELNFKNIKDLLEKYKKAFENAENSEDAFIYINNFNETLEKFINSIDNSFDNETLLEKYYLYIKELFLSYIETLKLTIEKGEQKRIINNIKKYIETFINKSSGYLSDILDLLSNLISTKKKIIFYGIIIFIIEKLNENGKKCLKKYEKYAKYHSLIYFEQAQAYYRKFLSNINEALLNKNDNESLQKAKKDFSNYIPDIKSGAIVLYEDTLRKRELFSTAQIGTGFTNDIKNYMEHKYEYENEICKIVLTNNQNLLSSIPKDSEPTLKEAICIANIIKIHNLLATFEDNFEYLIKLADRCIFILNNIKFDKTEKWYTEFVQLNKELDKKRKEIEPKKKYILQKYSDKFSQIDEIFEKDKKEFINFITTQYPYKNYNNNENTINTNEYNKKLLDFLLEKYQSDNYNYTPEDENSQFIHFIMHEISAKLSNLYQNYK